MTIGEINPAQQRSVSISSFNNKSKALNTKESYVDDSNVTNIDQTTTKNDQC